MKKLLNVTRVAGKADYSRNSSDMQIDDSSYENSPSIMRFFLSLHIVACFDSLVDSNTSNNNIFLINRARLFDLAVSLLPGLNAEEVDVLFVPIKAALQV